MRRDASSSTGLGGSGPVVMMRRFGCSVACAIRSTVAPSGRRIGGQALVVGEIEHPVHPRTAQVGVQEDGVAPGLGDRHGQVGGRSGLALLRHGAGDQDRSDRVIDIGEIHVGAKGSIRLRSRPARVEQGGQTVLRVAPTAQPHARDRADRGQAGQGLDVFRGLQRVIQILQEKRQGDCVDQCQQGDDRGVEGDPRAGRLGRDLGRIDDGQDVGAAAAGKAQDGGIGLLERRGAGPAASPAGRLRRGWGC